MDAPKKVEITQEQKNLIKSHGVDPQLLLESITEAMAKSLPMKEGIAKQRNLFFLVKQELDVSILFYIEREKKKEEREGFPHAHNPFDNSSRVEALCEKFKDLRKDDDELEEDVTVPDVNKKMKPAGMTLLHMAVMDKEVAEVKRLLFLGADPKIEDSFNLSPLDRAISMKHEEIIGLLKSSPVG